MLRHLASICPKLSEEAEFRRFPAASTRNRSTAGEWSIFKTAQEIIAQSWGVDVQIKLLKDDSQQNLKGLSYDQMKS